MKNCGILLIVTMFGIVVIGPRNKTNAQTLTTLHVFTMDEGVPIEPQGPLVAGCDGNFYNVLYNGGPSEFGSFFRVNPNGSFTNLYTFSGGSDGADPSVGLVLGSDGSFYDTAGFNPNGLGTVFRVATNGTLTTLLSFTDSDGCEPQGLVLGTPTDLYGVTQGCNGPFYPYGSVFQVSTNGTLTQIYQFSGSASDWSWPATPLVKGTDTNFYGMTGGDGVGGHSGGTGGTVFRISPTGAFTNLYAFSGQAVSDVEGNMGSSRLVEGSDSNFYGTVPFGGNTVSNTDGWGSIFQITPSGTLTTLHTFNLTDGGRPSGPLVEGSDGNFYGVATAGGVPNVADGNGVVYRVSPSGGYTNVYSFQGESDGQNPIGGLVQGSDGSFYGLTSFGFGSIFKLQIPLSIPSGQIVGSLPNQISMIRPVSTNVVITIPSITGENYQLQYSDSMSTALWSNVSGASLSNSLGGPISLTDIGGAINTQRFYRVDVSTCAGHTYTDPAGFTTLTIIGTNVPPIYSFLSLGLCQLPVLRGTTTAITGQKISLDAPLLPAQYSENTSGGSTNPSYFIEFTSGANAGLRDDIVSNDAVSVYTSNDDSSVESAGVMYKLYPHWTIGSVFGPTNSAGLLGGATSGVADNIQIWNPNSQGYTTYYYKTGGIGGTGWHSASSAIINSSNAVLYIDQGILIVRRASADVPIVLFGGVKLGQTISSVVSSGSTYVGNVYAAGVALGTSGLYTTNSATGVNGGASASSADNVEIWNPNTQGYTTYYYKNGGLLGGTGWRSTVSPSIDTSTNQIPEGAVALIVRKIAGSFAWPIPAPY